MSKRRRRPSPPPSRSTASPSPPSDDRDWFAISEILDERRRHGRLEYLVDWEGKDTRTGERYDRSWISASEVTLDARAEWASKKPARQPASPHPVASLVAEDSAGGRSSAHSSQGQPRAVSLQTDDRPPKRRRLRRAASDPSSPTSATTDSHDRKYQPSQLWEASSLHTQPRNAATLVVELAPAHDFDPSDYLSVQLSQASVEGATQPSSSVRASERHGVSQRTIPDSQESLSHDNPNDSQLEPESLRAALGPPPSQPVSIFDSWPSVLSEEQGQDASQGYEVIPGNPLSDLLRQPSAERSNPEGIPPLGSNSEPSIPARQVESFPNQPDSLGADNQHSHGAHHDSFQASRLHSSLTRVSEQASSGPHFHTQPHSVLFPLPSASSSGPTDSRDKGSSVIPDSTYKSDRGRVAKSTQELQSDNSHGADYGSAQPRGSVCYASQVVSNLVDSSHLLTGPESSSVGDHAVPETVHREPQLLFNRPWAESSPHLDQSGVRFSPERDSARGDDLLGRQSPQPFVTPPPMEGAEQHDESPAIAELRRIQQESLMGSEAPSLLGFGESAEADDSHRDQASPPRNLHDPVIFSTAAGGVQPNTVGAPLALGSIPRFGAEAPETTPLFPTQEQPPSHDDAIPVTVAPSDIQPQELNPLTVAPMDITTSAELPSTGGRHLPGHGAVFPGRQPVSLDPQSNLAFSMQEDEADEPHRLPDDEPKEFIVTLPSPANQRPFYDDIIMDSRPDIESFCRIFSNEVLRTPKPSAIHKIEALFLKLLDISDYPPHLDTASWDSMSPKEVQNYLYESNAKFALIWDLLALLRDMPTKVLIIARSERLLSFMETLAVVEGYAFSRTGLQDMQFEHARSPLSIVLALPDQDLPDAPSDFDLVFGYDFEFRRSVFADRLAGLQPGQKHPMVLTLVITHSLEHIDLCITDKDPDIPELDRKNALVVALTKIRGMIVNPELGRAKPHEIAQHFASLLGGPAEPRDYEPVPLPDSVLDVYLDPTQPEEGPFDEGGLDSRKRKLGDFEENDPKRQKLGAQAPMVNAKRVEAISSLLNYLGVEVLDGGDADDDVPVPRALLKAVEAKVHAEQKAQEEAKVREQELKELKSLNASLSRQNEEYAGTISVIQTHLQGAIEERGQFERQKNSAETRVKSLESRVQSAEEEKVRLAAEVADLKTKKDLGDGPAGAAPSVPGDDAGVQAEMQRVKKQVEAMERELDYTREAYQTASQAASDLGNENRELATRNKDLEHRASDNLRRIHEASGQAQVAEYLRVQDELEVQMREREAEIERLREDIKAMKMRRETRQSSVPRSPRMGVMSPRAGGGRGAASRGSSPALDSPGLPIFGQQGGNNSRWGHLRD